MLDWWMQRPWWIRLGVAVALIVLGIVMFLSGPDVTSRRGGTSLVISVVGFVLLCFAGPSDSERRGYKF